jgi:hypothetical protein
MHKIYPNSTRHTNDNNTLKKYETEINKVFDLFANISNFSTLKRFIDIYFEKMNRYLLMETLDGFYQNI